MPVIGDVRCCSVEASDMNLTIDSVLTAAIPPDLACEPVVVTTSPGVSGTYEFVAVARERILTHLSFPLCITHTGAIREITFPIAHYAAI